MNLQNILANAWGSIKQWLPQSGGSTVIDKNTVSPTPRPDPNMIVFNKDQPQLPQVSPQIPQSTPIPANDNFVFNYEPYLRNMQNPPSIPQPDALVAKILRDTYPTDATRAAIVASREGGLRAYPTPYVNTTGKKAGSTDVGMLMMNAGKTNSGVPTTFDDLMRRFPQQMSAAGVIPGNSKQYPDVNQSIFDPAVNARINKINFDDPGNTQGWWGRWFGLRNGGFNKADFIGKTAPY